MFYLQHFFKKMVFAFTTILSDILLRSYRITKGENIKFNGFPLIKCKPNSTIRIGNSCIFNSAQNSNLVGINRPCTIATHKRKALLSIGNNCGFSGTVIGAFDNIKIGNRVICGANTVITDSDWHGILPTQRSSKYAKSAPIVIEDDVWLGLNVVVLKGVTIGEGSVIAANSVVVGNVPPCVIAGGNPCKVIKKISC